ncbi:MAG: acyl-CoA dehydrogenase family protein [Minwuia sp.]|uniref:acyl-CoA dehydrogenase family protein n=1 Tax=Minwuia sp. TaxID=2493630 RepID=UPI003A87A0C9
MIPAGTELAAYARKVIAPRALDLIRSDDFPWDIWKEMGESGWLGFGMGDDGGIEATPAELFDVAAAVAEAAEVVGLCTSWMTHHMVAGRVIAEYADAEQRPDVMPDLAAGRRSACIAISEPGAGAHPKRLSTRAEKVDGGWRLTGEKAWLTNGPIADIFVTIAITSEQGGRKRFGAFLVPHDAEGVSQTEGVKIDFAKPSGHCGLKMENAFLPDGAYLAGAGDAVETVLKRFRRVEDCIGLATKAGAMAVQLRRLAAILPAEKAVELGALDADRQLYLAGGRQLMADSGGDPASPEHEARLLALRRLGRRFGAAFAELKAEATGQDEFLDLLTRDLQQLGKVAERVDAAKLAKTGSALLNAAAAG